MTPFIDKITLIALGGLCTVVIWQQVLLGRQPVPFPYNAGTLATLQHAYDSVTRHSGYLEVRIDSLVRRVDTLLSEKRGYQQQAAALRDRLQKTIHQYADLPRYDSFSVRDLRRYLSDSLP